MRRTTSGGIFALATLGLYVLFRNREQMVSFLDRQGIHLPDTSRLRENLRSGATQVIDQVKDVLPDKNEQVGQVRRTG